MEYISVSQQVGDVSQQLYDREKAAGHVAAPMMGGLHDLLQVTDCWTVQASLPHVITFSVDSISRFHLSWCTMTDTTVD